MKRSINLVSYESSDDDDEDSENANSETTKSYRRKLPTISPSLTAPTPIDDPALHQGRIRSTPHVEGQFSAFVYVPAPLRRSSPLRELLEKALRHAKEIEPDLVCDWLNGSETYTLHISLTRPIYLRHHQREDLKRTVKAAARTVLPFTASFSIFSTFTNDERTRAFLGIEVGAGHQGLESLSKAIEPALGLLHQRVFYSEPHFHASIAWALLNTAVNSNVEVSITSIPEPRADEVLLPRPVLSLPPSLVPELNSQFGQSLSSSRVGVFEADRVCVKIGKDTFNWPLGKE